jgi:hypothetical protein
MDIAGPFSRPMERQGVKHLSFALCLFYGLAVEMVLVGAKH